MLIEAWIICHQWGLWGCHLAICTMQKIQERIISGRSLYSRSPESDSSFCKDRVHAVAGSVLRTWGMSCPSWHWHRTGHSWSPVRTLLVAPWWPGMLFPNSSGNKAVANLHLFWWLQWGLLLKSHSWEVSLSLLNIFNILLWFTRARDWRFNRSVH